MLQISNTPDLLNRLNKLREIFENNKKDPLFLGDAYSSFKDVDEWKYSTGAIFDQPPYGHEMAGFDGGRLLKKKYSSPYEARLKGFYSSGFTNEQHRITVSPSKPASMPLNVSRFRQESDEIIYIEHIKYYDHLEFKSQRAPALNGMGVFFKFDVSQWVHIGVGDGGAYSITLYRYNSKNLIEMASSVTAPFDFQSEYNMHYNASDELISITSSDMTVWRKK